MEEEISEYEGNLYTKSIYLLCLLPSIIILLIITFTFSSLTRSRFYPQRCFSGQTSRGFRCRPFSPPARAFILSRKAFNIPTASRRSSNVANSRFRAFHYSIYVQEKVLTSVHSVRLEPTKLILVGTRTTYRATGDACTSYHTRETWTTTLQHRTPAAVTSAEAQRCV